MRFNVGERICAWCAKYLGPFEGTGVSHGICAPCADLVRAQAGLPLQKKEQ